ncbi:MAG: flavodoxin family protein [Anaerolineae bacterium]|nr:flavodoxin family protein [Anaerolineae bacterium]
MNILILIGSYRKNGNTERVAKLIAERLDALAAAHHADLQMETIRLGEWDISSCRGCRVCFDRGEQFCPLRDALLPLKEKIKAANGLVLASPVYVDDVSGLVKNWIDRLAHVCHRPEFGGKVAILVATVGASPTAHTLRSMASALITWGFQIVDQVGFNCGARMDDDELHAQHTRRAQRAAKRLFTALHQQRYLNPPFLALLTFKIQQTAWRREAPGSVDREYWETQGWLAPGSTYYIRHRAGPLKVWLARLAGSVIEKFVL